MSLAELLAALQAAVATLDEESLRDELAPILPADELAGLVPRLRGGVVKVVEAMRPHA